MAKIRTRSFNELFYVPIITSLYNDGYISDTDLKDKKVVREKADSFIRENIDNIDFSFVIDHRETLITIANKEYENRHDELAISLYATYVEHCLNRIIHLVCNSKKIDEKSTIEIIKNVNIIGKCTWLFKLLGLAALNAQHVKTILNLAEQRNSYFHYKWKPDRDFEKSEKKDEKERSEKEKKIKLLLKYLRNYESKIEFKGKKGLIKNLTANYR